MLHHLIGARRRRWALRGWTRWASTPYWDILGTFLLECKLLLDLMFQKMNGNPIFVLEFLRSLVKRGLLEYGAGERRWAWEENHIGTVDMAGNTLHLFSSKRSGLSETMQLALKAAVCFGVINELVIAYLSNTVIS